MKIYGKDFKEIYADIPWTYQIVVVLGSCFIVFSIIYCTYIYATFSDRLTEKKDLPQVVKIEGTQKGGGLLDPAMASDGQTQAMAMTYLAHIYNVPDQVPYYYFNTIVTLNVNKCKSWSQTGTPVFKGGPDTLMGPDGITPLDPGDWRYETPGLVYDPGDKGREWKVYAYKYYANKEPSISPLYSGIVYKYAADPHGPWSDEQWILSAAPDKPPPPYGGLVHQFISQMAPAVSNLYSFSRPSVVYSGGVLFMSLSAFQQGFSTPVGVILLASADHGKTWQYINTLMTMQDAKNAGHETLGGGGLFIKDDDMYFYAVFGDKNTAATGSSIIKVTNPVKGLLNRDPKTNDLVIEDKIPLNTIARNPRGGGYMAYNDDCRAAGAFESEFSGTFGRYVIFQTFHRPMEVQKEDDK
jgi:hypothetical protein